MARPSSISAMVWPSISRGPARALSWGLALAALVVLARLLYLA